MGARSYCRGVLGIALVAENLSGCGGARSSAVPQSAMTQAQDHKASGRSWMLPEAKSGDLIYAATVHAIVVMSYPQGKVVAKILGDYGDSEVCSDPNNGNVFVANGDEDVVEYAHGGTTPIATLKAPSGDKGLNGCAVDPATGDLAVATYEPGGVLVWPKAKGKPTPYTDDYIPFCGWPVYGNAGNLYLDCSTKDERFRIAELRAGQNHFTLIRYPRGIEPPGEFQWDGKYLVFTELEYSGYGDALYQIKITGRTSEVVNTSHLLHSGEDRSIWLQDGLLFGILKKIRRNGEEAVAVWNYPSGGKPIARFYGLQNNHYGNLPTLTVSVAPSGSRIRK